MKTNDETCDEKDEPGQTQEKGFIFKNWNYLQKNKRNTKNTVFLVLFYVYLFIHKFRVHFSKLCLKH